MWLSRISFLLLATAVCVVSELGQAAAQPSLHIEIDSGGQLISGSTHDLRCVLGGVNSTNGVMLEWTFNGEPVSASGFTPLSPVGNTFVSSYTLLLVTSQEEGNYMCSAVSTSFNLSASIGITVLDTPVAEAESPVRQKIGNTLLLNCSTSSTPKPTMVWFFNGSMILQQHPSNEDYGQLTREAITEEDGGVYACEVTNKAGSGRVEITVIVLRPASEPVNVTVDDRVTVEDNSTQIAITWENPLSPGEPHFTNFSVKVTAESNGQSVFYNTQANSLVLENLQPGTTYSIQVFAVIDNDEYDVGPSPGSAVLTAATEVSAPMFECDGLTADDGQVKVSWSGLQTGGEKLTVDELVVEYRPNNTQDYQAFEANLAPDKSYVDVSEDFLAGNDYQVQLTLTNSDGQSDTQSCGAVLIIEGIPSQPAVPLDFLDDSGGVTLVLQTRYSGAGDTGSFKFVVRVERVDREGTQAFLQSYPLPNYQDGEEVMVMPSGLYGGKYVFTAFASNAFGDSAVSEASRAVTVTAQPPMLSNLDVSFDGEAFILAWEVSEDPEAPVTEYVVRMTYADEEEVFRKPGRFDGQSGATTTLEVEPSRVFNNTVYQFTITALSSVGNSESLMGDYKVILEDPTITSSRASSLHHSSSQLTGLLFMLSMFLFCFLK